MNCKDIITILESLYPQKDAVEWDNVGLLVGDEQLEVKKILLALDGTTEVIDEAIQIKADMIISHHPLFRDKMSRIIKSDIIGNKIIKLISNNINYFAMHTNVDKSLEGTNKFIYDEFKMIDFYQDGFFNSGELVTPLQFSEFIDLVKSTLNLEHLVYVGDEQKVIKKIGFCSGGSSINDLIQQAKDNNCDVYISGDLKYHTAHYANDIDICLIDGTHFGTEILFKKYFKTILENNLSGVEIIESKIEQNVMKIK